MQFSLFYEMQIADPSRQREAELFRACTAQATLADELGYHCVWAVEHHGLFEYAHSSAPEIFLSFVAARTRRIRLGHGVTLTPHRFNHPIRVAERVATLDILSGGRVNWGSGKSSSNVEAELFEIERETLDPLWEEALHMIPRMWQDDVFEWSGKNYRVRPTQIVPKPLQSPHPPIFMPVSRPESLVRAGRLGVGALNFSVANYDDLRAGVRTYKAALAEANPVDWQKNDRYCVTANTCVLPQDDEACRYGLTGARFFRDSFDHYYMRRERPQLGPLPVSREPLSGPMLKVTADMRRHDRTQMLSIIGDPALAREKVAMFRDAGIDELLLIMQLGTVPNDIVLRSLVCFAEQVMPHFA